MEANAPDAIIEGCSISGCKIVYVDSSADIEMEATFSTDNSAVGKTMLKKLTENGESIGGAVTDTGISVLTKLFHPSCLERQQPRWHSDF